MVNMFDIYTCNKCGSENDRQPMYYGYGRETDHTVAFFFEIPGGDLKSKDKEEERRFDLVKFVENGQIGCDHTAEVSRYWRCGMLRWIFENHRKMFQPVVYALSESGFINRDKRYKLASWEGYYQYVIQAAEKEIYFSDVVKCRPRYKGKMYREYEANKRCPTLYLEQEIKLLKNLELIIVFGYDTFSVFRETVFQGQMELVTSSNGGARKRMSHGDVYRLSKDGLAHPFVILSLHPSSMRRLKKGEFIDTVDNLTKSICGCAKAHK
ncbi:uracil-DNA glycosylase family protein [Kyrpidia sp.]|uniref:uracil-DNA glycosylase family protein n=1 Tax=Kyrpidia sp. TaxID=2073077 RepID=UPI002591185A|nr:uracil-DNA glycosylase family protein [Kyrpidia sp.]MCL6576120.1 hypothetical protein [Kyrpidia sp.]